MHIGTMSAEGVRSLEDIERLESVPLPERELPESTYELIRGAVEANPETIAIRYFDQAESWSDEGGVVGELSVSYRQLLGHLHQTANLFHALGLGAGDCVSMALPNVPEAHYILWGGEACGIVNPINYLLEGREIGEIIAAAGSRILVAYGEHPDVDVWQKLPDILAAATCVEHVVIVGGEAASLPAGYLHFATACADQPGERLAFERGRSPEDIASLFHTGGTTGLPKLVRHSHGNEVYTSWAVNALATSQQAVCYLTALPLFHCNAAIGSGLSVFARGGTVLLAGINGFRSPGVVLNFYRILSHYRVSHFNLVPTVVGILTQLPCEEDLASVEFAVCGAAPMPVDLFRRFQQHTGIRLLEGYGLTEATVCSSMTPPQSAQPRIGSIGVRLPYTQMTVAEVDADGVIVGNCATDEVGALLIRGPSMTAGYLNPAQNDGLFARDAEGERWLNTGDLARQDIDGYFWLTGRKKELIIRGGHNIDPKSIEEALAAHPAVNLVAAVGRPDAYAGEVPVAYVDTRSDVSEAALIDWCTEHIGERAAIPKAIIILDQLPVTGIGKIHKPTLQLREIETVARGELASLGDSAVSIDIKAVADKTYGNTLKVIIQPQHSSRTADLLQTAEQKLGAYSFKSLVEIAQPASNSNGTKNAL